MRRLRDVLIGVLLVLAVSSAMATTTGWKWPVGEYHHRNTCEYYSLTAGAAATTVAITTQCKGILVVNEGANPARIRVDGGTPTSTVGVLLAAGASYSNENFSTELVSAIRTGGSDTTLRIETSY
ncbi:MAG: hypothetical protein AABY75_05405 [Bacteroidota bacterium]